LFDIRILVDDQTEFPGLSHGIVSPVADAAGGSFTTNQPTFTTRSTGTGRVKFRIVDKFRAYQCNAYGRAAIPSSAAAAAAAGRTRSAVATRFSIARRRRRHAARTAGTAASSGSAIASVSANTSKNGHARERDI
jgi:hypothetical protein